MLNIRTQSVLNRIHVLLLNENKQYLMTFLEHIAIINRTLIIDYNFEISY